jgi:hypothetical protein
VEALMDEKFDPAVCRIKCVCGETYDSTVNTERQKHYFHKKEGEMK